MIGRTIRVLVVDDDREDAEFVQDLLADVQEWTAKVSIATTYEAGRTLLAGREVDVGLLDYRLGARNGIELLEEPEVATSGIPVIVLTGQGGRDVEDAALRAGATDYLPKDGLTTASLERAIRYAWERSRRRHVEARLRALQANSRELVSILGPDATLLYVSPSLQRALGRRPEEVQGGDAFTDIHREDRDRVMAEFRRVLEDPGYVAQLQYRIRHADGSWRTLDTWAENYLDDPDIQGIVVGSWDVTASVEQAEHIRFQAALLGAVGQAVVATDLQRRVISWNGAAERLYGWRAEEVLGRPIADLAIATHSAARAEGIYAKLAAGEAWSDQVPMRRRDGTTFLALVSATSLTDAGGRSIGYVGVSSDITHLAQVELDLRERVKELRLLVDAGRILNRHGAPVADRLRALVDRMPAAWLHPDVTEARLEYDRETIATDGFRETPWMLRAPIPGPLAGGGKVEVALTEERPDVDGGPFLPEERELIETLARTIGEALERGRLARILEQTFASLGEAVLIIDSRGHGRLIADVNAAAQRIFGWSRDEMVGRTTEMLHVDREHFERFAAAGDGELERTGVTHLRFPLRRKDGTVFQAEQTVMLIDPTAGLEGGAVSVIRDVSEQAEAEATLRRTEERFRVLSREISDVICVVDAEGTVLYISPSVEPAAGYSAEELEGTNVLALVHPEDQATVEGLLAQVAATEGESVRGAYRIQTRSGATLHVESMARNLLSHPNVGGIVVSIRDVTERMEFEARLRQSQRMEAIGALAGGVAHDFNNILTVISAQADLLTLDLEDEGLRHDVGLIRGAAERASTLTGQLLAFGREQVLRSRVVDLEELLHGMGRMLDRIIGEDVRISYDVPTDVRPVVVDPAQLEQVLMNLAANARDAMPKGGELTFSLRQEALDVEGAAPLPGMQPGRYTVLSVSDTGTGMSQEVLERVFEPFFTTKEKDKGTGLGLAMAYGVMKQSGGGIHVESTPGAGTTFHLRFPASEKQAESLGEARTQAPPDGDVAGSVLMVEDDPAVRRVTRRVLERAGFTVATAEDAESAVRMLEEQPPDVLLTDLVLPGMSGRQLVEHVMATLPDLPILVWSGYDRSSPGHRGELPPSVGFLQKPFTTEALIAALRKAMAPPA